MDAVIDVQAMTMTGPAILVAGGTLFLWLLKRYMSDHKRGRFNNLPPLPEIPGVPVIGNILQLKEKKPHLTFAKWAQTYGPIYSIRTGSNTIVVLNSNDLAKEAMVTRHQSISTRKLSTALKILSFDKTMVAMSDYDEFHKTVKRHILANILGPNALKRHRSKRDTLIENTSKYLHAHIRDHPLEAANFRHIFESELFGYALKQVLGKDIDEPVYLDELGITLSREEIIRVLVSDMMEGAAEVDWRDLFPYLKWIPNKSFENKINQKHIRRLAVMKALVQEHTQLAALGKKTDCYLDFLQSEAKTLTEKQVMMLLWEVIIETSDTLLITTEWAMYELAKDHKRQEDLHAEILSVCGNDKVTEDKLCWLPYLSAVFHETLRKHSPAPIVPLKYVHEDTQLGGYHVPAKTEIAINIYGCNMDKNAWASPEQWMPERFLDEKYDPIDLHKTIAFGGGRRVCAGANEAMIISCTTIGRLIQDFHWRLGDGEEEKTDTIAFTMHKLHPLRAHLKPRRS